MIKLLAHDPSGRSYFTSTDEDGADRITIHHLGDSRPATWRAVWIAFTNHDFDVPPLGSKTFADIDDMADYLDTVFQDWVCQDDAELTAQLKTTEIRNGRR